MPTPLQSADRFWIGWDRDHRLAAFEIFCAVRRGYEAHRVNRDCRWDLEALLADGGDLAALESPTQLAELLRTDEVQLTTAWSETIRAVGADDWREALHAVRQRLSNDGAAKRSVEALDQLVGSGDTTPSVAAVAAGLVEIRRRAQEEFVGFLDGLDDATYAEVEYAADQRAQHSARMAALLATYVAELRPLTDLDREADPRFLGAGKAGAAFAIDSPGRPWALKIMYDRIVGLTDEPVRINLATEIHALRKAMGVRGAQQLVTYSIEDRILVSELGAGQSVDRFGILEKPPYLQHHLFGLIDTMIELHARGLHSDPNPANLLYHPDAGFVALEPMVSTYPAAPFETVLRVSKALTWAYRQSSEARHIQFGGDEAAHGRLKLSCARVETHLVKALWAHRPDVARAYLDYVTGTNDPAMGGVISLGSAIPKAIMQFAPSQTALK